ncbi:MAG: NosD domain-containing protein [Promethearchaeota archaeon]
MTYQKHKLWIFFILILIVSATIPSILISKNFFEKNDGPKYIDLNDEISHLPKNSGVWVLDPIIIDNDGGGDYTWTQAVAQPEGWCSGSGSIDDPYVIENVTIDGNGLSSCLTIRDSNVNFIIRNCYFFNLTDDNYNLGGIDLENVNNSKIIDNIFLDNHIGIHLYSSYNNIIQNNYIDTEGFLNPYVGIFLEHYSQNNSIIENEINNNYHQGNGIILNYECDFNTISGNLVLNNVDDGIWIGWSSFNHVLHNTILNSYNGIKSNGFSSPQTNNNNTIKNNFLSNNNIGVLMQGTLNSTISNNFIHNSTETGFSILDTGSKDNIIFNNSFYGNIVSHAIDNGIDNKWDDGIIGNYWENYTNPEIGGIDNSPYDGIGDIIYSILGSANAFDSKPIFEIPYHIGEKIHIDGNGENGLNWSQTALVKWWCKGAGTVNNPYAIRNIIIDGKNTGSCLYIENTRDFFNLDNNSLHNSGSISLNAGINLVNITNGIIDSNNCSNNNGNGIYLNNSGSDFINNIIIVKNILSSNFYNGLCIQNLDFSNISNNTISFNNQYGIWIDESNNNTIYFNKFLENDEVAYCSNSSNNSWDNGTRGNYWGDYNEKYPDAANNLIFWHTPYQIDADSIDYFPLVNMDASEGINIVPIISHPIDKRIAVGSVENDLEWIIFDTTFQDPTYTIYMNGTPIETNSWTSGSPVELNLSTLPIGIYNFTILVSDGLDGYISDSVIITSFYLLEAPIWITNSQTIICDNITVSWNAVSGATSYRLYVNGILNETTSNTSQGILLNRNGTYFITINAQNASGISDYSVMIVIIVEISLVNAGDNADDDSSGETQPWYTQTWLWPAVGASATVLFGLFEMSKKAKKKPGDIIKRFVNKFRKNK